jgi:hypothetical protein
MPYYKLGRPHFDLESKGKGSIIPQLRGLLNEMQVKVKCTK